MLRHDTQKPQFDKRVEKTFLKIFKKMFDTQNQLVVIYKCAKARHKKKFQFSTNLSKKEFQKNLKKLLTSKVNNAKIKEYRNGTASKSYKTHGRGLLVLATVHQKTVAWIVL